MNGGAIGPKTHEPEHHGLVLGFVIVTSFVVIAFPALLCHICLLSGWKLETSTLSTKRGKVNVISAWRTTPGLIKDISVLEWLDTRLVNEYDRVLDG